jgi:hypothetical protein
MLHLLQSAGSPLDDTVFDWKMKILIKQLKRGRMMMIMNAGVVI